MAQIIKRIFLTGPPGSMWSGCDRRLREAFIDIDNSDWIPERQWDMSNRGQMYAGHIPHRGAYFNKGNEFGNWICDFRKYSRQEILETLDSVFVPQPDKEILIRIHKAHEFSIHLEQIKEQFPEAAIITVNNDPHRCLANWGICDGHDHYYDSYQYYKRDYEWIWETINYQHYAIKNFNRTHSITTQKLTKKWIIDNFTSKLNPPYNDGITPLNVDGVETLYNSSDMSLGLAGTVELSLVPWKDNPYVRTNN